MDQHSKEYTKYLRSREWQEKRLAALRRTMNKCEVCGIQKHREGLEVHHKTYERLGRELDSDLMVVCKACHPKEDERRRHRVNAEREDRRLDAWASKVYGENWDERFDYDRVDEAFERWLRKKGEW